MVVFETGDGNAVLFDTQCLIALRRGWIKLGYERRTLGLELANVRLDCATLLLEALGMMRLGMVGLGKGLGHLLGKVIDLYLTLEQLVLLDGDVLLTLDLALHIARDGCSGTVICIRVELFLQGLDLGDDTLLFGLEFGELALDFIEKLHDLVLLALDFLCLLYTSDAADD